MTYLAQTAEEFMPTETAHVAPESPNAAAQEPSVNNAPDTSTGATTRKPWQFQPGNPGRPKGARNQRSLIKDGLLDWFIEGDEVLPSFRERVRELLLCDDPAIRLAAERHWFDQAFGKARESVDVTHHGLVVDEAKERMAGKVWGQLAAVPDDEPEKLAEAV